MIAVGTPTRQLDGNADLQYVYAAAEEIARALDHYAVDRHQIDGAGRHRFPGQAHRCRSQSGAQVRCRVQPGIFAGRQRDLRFRDSPTALWSAPTATPRASCWKNSIARFTENGVELIRTDLVSSELIKYAANTFLATKVSFINEMADICERVGGNIVDVSRGMGSDKRIGHAFLKPGPGYGGSCFPKDTLAMVHIGERVLSPATIVEAVIAVNRSRTHRMVAKIAQAAGSDLQGKRIALLGLTFKPNTDDVRDSVAILIADELSQMGAIVRAYDPQGMQQARKILGNAIAYCGSADDALEDADLCVVATEWNEFRDKKPIAYKRLMAEPVMVDLRNVFSPDEMAEHGFTYVSVGRSAVERKVLAGGRHGSWRGWARRDFSGSVRRRRA